MNSVTGITIYFYEFLFIRIDVIFWLSLLSPQTEGETSMATVRWRWREQKNTLQLIFRLYSALRRAPFHLRLANHVVHPLSLQRYSDANPKVLVHRRGLAEFCAYRQMLVVAIARTKDLHVLLEGRNIGWFEYHNGLATGRMLVEQFLSGYLMSATRSQLAERLE